MVACYDSFELSRYSVREFEFSLMYTLKRDSVLLVLLCIVPLTGCSRSGVPSESNSDQILTAPTSSQTSGHSIELWNTKAAASYLDQRAAWWAGWSAAGRDHNTFCVSC